MTRRVIPTLIVALGLLVAPATSSAKINVAVGIGDQSPRMFSDPAWTALKLKKARYFVEWNAIDQPEQLRAADAYVAAARAAGVKVLMHVSTDDINSVPLRPLPSVAAYTSKVRQLVKRYKPSGVTDWGVWNEANHKSQPTRNNPKRAAQFYRAFKRFCSGCKIVALDVLDQSGVEKYIARWMKYAGPSGRTAKVIGIHNYSEVNRKLREKRSAASLKKYPGTARIIRAVRKKNTRAKFWYTETGGLASFASFACDRQRQANRTNFMFSMIKRYDKDVERLYSYNWFGTSGGGCQGFDAGLVEADGTPRPAFATFRKGLKTATR